MNFETSYDSEAKIWHSTKTKAMFDPYCSIGRVILYMLRSKPSEAICQISDSEGTTLTYGQLAAYAVRLAGQMDILELTQDDVVGIVSGNTTMLMPLIAACWIHLTPFQAINPIHEEHVIELLYGITKPKIIFCDGLYYDKVKQATRALNIPIYTLTNHLEGVPNIEEFLEPTGAEMFYQAPPLKYGPDQTVAIMCSSGTTGPPKPVTVSNAKLNLEIGVLNGDTVTFAFSLPDWSSSLVNIIVTLLIGGQRIITTKPFSPEYILEIIAKYKVTFVILSPIHVVQILQLPNFNSDKLQSLKVVFITGGHCSPANVEHFRSLIPLALVFNSYGASEVGGISGCFSDYKSDTVGQLLPNNEIRIVDLKTREPLGPNEVGEIWVRSPFKWLGYYNNEQATREIMDAEGWINTGDVGLMDEEHYLHLIDRTKDIMKYVAFQFSPKEIEDTIALLPDVLDVCVFGVTDEKFGDLAAAAIVKKSGSKLTEAEVMKFVAEKNSLKHKQLNYGVFFVPAIPRNVNGKILRNEMKQKCLEIEKKQTIKSKM